MNEQPWYLHYPTEDERRPIHERVDDAERVAAGAWDELVAQVLIDGCEQHNPRS